MPYQLSVVGFVGPEFEDTDASVAVAALGAALELGVEPATDYTVSVVVVVVVVPAIVVVVPAIAFVVAVAGYNCC